MSGKDKEGKHSVLMFLSLNTNPLPTLSQGGCCSAPSCTCLTQARRTGV